MYVMNITDDYNDTLTTNITDNYNITLSPICTINEKILMKLYQRYY